MKCNILTVDGFSVVQLGVYGVIPKHHINQYKMQFAKDMGINYDGVGCVFQSSKLGLGIWFPKTKQTGK
jgi:hypothetical protein